jgi:hypothetical protein
MKNILIILLTIQCCFATAYYIETPFDADEIPNLQYAQADNEMYLVSGTDIPQVLTRTAHNAWTITDMTMETGPFLPLNTTSTTITPSGTLTVGGAVTLTASSSIFVETHEGSIWQIDQKRPNVFQGTIDATESSAATYFFKGNYSFVTEGTWDGTITLQRSENGTDWESALEPLTNMNFDNVGETEPDGAYYRVTGSSWTSGACNYTLTITDEYNHGIVLITPDTGYTSGTVVTGTVITAIYDTSATKRWREGYWSDYRGWPKTVCFHQQRLIFGGSDSYPQTVWFGRQDPEEYYNFTEGTLDTDAFTAILPGQNPVRWLLSGDYLFIGTSGSTGTYGELGKSITPTSPNYRTQSVGAEDIMAVWANDTILYVERGAEKIREFKYQLDIDKYQSSDLTLLAEDITDSGIKEIAFQQRHYPILWCVLNSGDIATMTFQRDQGVIGWALQTTDGDFESIASIPGSGAEDEVWVIAKRSINGADIRYVEQFQPIDWGADADHAWFVDCGLEPSEGVFDPPTATISGLSHLEGETVQVYADGVVLGDETVTDGSITIDTEASYAIVGLPYTATLETMPLSFAPNDQTYEKKLMRLWVDLLETGDLQYGSHSSNLTSVVFNNELKTSSVALEKYTFPPGSKGKSTVYLQSTEPVPVTIRAIVPEITAYPVQ